MKLLSTLVLIFLSQYSFAGVITTIESDWSTYRLDLVADSNYTGFGGGPAGDIFRVYFDFNRAYLPYISSHATDEMEDYTGRGIQDPNSVDQSDRYVFTETPTKCCRHTLEINGKFFDISRPYSLHISDGEIDSVNMYGFFNSVSSNNWDSVFILDDDGKFSISVGHDIVTGTLSNIEDLGKLVEVPEPGMLTLYLLGLMGFPGCRKPKARM